MTSERDATGLPPGLVATLTERIGAGLGTVVRIEGLRRLTGGTSHDSWALDAVAGQAVHPLILRREFGTEALDVSLAQECALLRRLEQAGLAVPRVIAHAEPAANGDTAYAVSERLEGGDLRKLLAKGAPDRATLGDRLVALQADLHAHDWRDLPAEFLDQHGPVALSHQVESWAETALAGVSSSDILLVSAIDRLRRACPDPGRTCLVHGDFKANNIVTDGAGRLAVIDWELAHVGDPLEDLAWTMLWTTRFDIVGGLLFPADYVAAYARASGAPVDPDRLAFWRLFVLVKLTAIFVKSAMLDGDGRPPRPTHAMLLRAMPWIHQHIAALLDPRARAMETTP